MQRPDTYPWIVGKNAASPSNPLACSSEPGPVVGSAIGFKLKINENSGMTGCCSGDSIYVSHDVSKSSQNFRVILCSEKFERIRANELS